MLDKQVVEELGGWVDARDQKMVAGAGAGDVEQMALGGIDLVEFAWSPTLPILACNGSTSSSQAATTTARNRLRLCLVPRPPRRTRAADDPSSQDGTPGAQTGAVGAGALARPECRQPWRRSTKGSHAAAPAGESSCQVAPRPVHHAAPFGPQNRKLRREQDPDVIQISAATVVATRFATSA